MSATLKQFDDIRERDVENYLVKQVKKLGGVCEKFNSRGRMSVPDRLLSFKYGQIVFVECKRPGKEPTEKQAADHKRRRDMGFRVEVVDSKEAVDELIQQLAKDLRLV